MPDPTSADPGQDMLAAVAWERDEALKRAEERFKSMNQHGNFLACEAADRLAWRLAYRYVEDVTTLRAELDALRAERDDLKYRLGLQVRDAIALQREVFDQRARLVQTEAVAEVARRWYRDFTSRDAWIATGDALAALEAPPVAADP